MVFTTIQYDPNYRPKNNQLQVENDLLRRCKQYMHKDLGQSATVRLFEGLDLDQLAPENTVVPLHEVNPVGAR